jgi:hypothetical protein
MVTAGAVVVAGAIATWAVSPSLASTAPEAAAATHHGGGRFTVVERALTDSVVDIGAKGDSLGDVLAFGNPIYTADNKTQIGSDQGSCVRTVVGKAWECEWTLTLKGGSLVVQGPFYDAADSVMAITGGTGKWSRARGSMKLHARDAQGTAFDFTYLVTD